MNHRNFDELLNDQTTRYCQFSGAVYWLLLVWLMIID